MTQLKVNFDFNSPNRVLGSSEDLLADGPVTRCQRVTQLLRTISSPELIVEIDVVNYDDIGTALDARE